MRPQLMRPCLLTAAFALFTLSVAPSAQAQGLLWSLPPDGSWVRYEGTYSQRVRRPDSTAGDLQLSWTRHLFIKSVGQEQAEYQGQMQPCRWIEFKVLTGKVEGGLIDAGPGSTRLYKVLVPEAAIDGQVLDAEGILVSFIPVVKGWRKLGDEDPQAIESGVLQVYPTLSFLQHYRDFQQQSTDPQPLDIPTGGVNATAWKGTRTMESRENRSINEAELFRSDDVPFGLAKWSVRDVREEKHTTQSRDLFRETMEVSIEMSAHEIGTNAETELVVE